VRTFVFGRLKLLLAFKEKLNLLLQVDGLLVLLLDGQLQLLVDLFLLIDHFRELLHFLELLPLQDLDLALQVLRGVLRYSQIQADLATSYCLS